MNWTSPDAGVRVIDDVLAFLGLGDLTKSNAGPLTRAGFDHIVRDLVVEMQRAAKKSTATGIEHALDRLDRDWPNLTDAQREETFRVASKSVQDAMNKGAPAVTLTVLLSIWATIHLVFKAQDAPLRSADPKRDRRVARSLRVITEAFMRTSGLPLLAAVAGNVARAVVNHALAHGWENDKIREELKTALGMAIAGRERTYYETVASVATSSARSYGQLAAFEAVGTKLAMWKAKRDPDGELDANVCELCRYMDGRIFDVTTAMGNFEKATTGTPAEVANSRPFLRVRLDADGRKKVYVETNGTRILIGTVGEDDDPDVNAKLQALGVCTCPAHPRCRCILVPITV